MMPFPDSACVCFASPLPECCVHGKIITLYMNGRRYGTGRGVFINRDGAWNPVITDTVELGIGYVSYIHELTVEAREASSIEFAPIKLEI